MTEKVSLLSSFSTVDLDIDQVQRSQDFVQDLMKTSGHSEVSETIKHLKECDNFAKDTHSSANSEIISECMSYFNQTKQNFSRMSEFNEEFAPELANINLALANSTYDYRSQDAYGDCLFFTDLLIDDFKPRYQNILKLSSQVTLAKDIQEAIHLLEDMFSMHKELNGFFVVIDNGFNDFFKHICSWINSITKELESQTSKGSLKFKSAESALSNTFGLLTDIHFKNNDLVNKTNTVAHHANASQLYLLGEISKLDLCKMFDLEEVVASAKRISRKISTVKESITVLRKEAVSAKAEAIKAYEILAKPSLPLLNANSLLGLALVRLQPHLMSYFELDEVDVFLIMLVQEIFDPLISLISELENQISLHSEQMIEQIVELDANLQNYKRSTVMDSTFYM